MTDSPLIFEKKFQRLKSDCLALDLADLKLLQLLDFWPELKEYQNKPAYQSYFDEYLPSVYELIIENNLADLSIVELQRLHDTISEMSVLSVGQEPCAPDNLGDAGRNPASGFDSFNIKIGIIGTALARKLFYVGEAERALAVLNSQSLLPDDIDSLNEFEILQSVYEKSQIENPELADLIRPILIEWQSEMESVTPDSINCLFVEKDNFGRGLRGRMRRLEAKNIETFGRSAIDDEITFEDIKVAPKDTFAGVAYDACDAVRKVFKAERMTQLSEAYYHAHFSIRNGKHTFTGDSIGLAFALLTYAKLLKPEIRRHEKFISSDVAFTGGIDSDGNIIPVNLETLEHKIDRAFFSPVKYLVIPEANRLMAEKILEQIRRNYSRRKLKLIPVETLREVINDPRVVRSDKVCMLPYITRIVYKYSRAAKIQIPILLVLIYLLACLIFPKAWIFFDWNPKTIDILPDKITAKNIKGQFLWQLDESQLDILRIDTSGSRSVLNDLNNDGNNESMLLLSPDYRISANSYCELLLVGNKGDILWDTLFCENKSIGSYQQTNQYRFRVIGPWNKFVNVRTGTGIKTLFITSTPHSAGSFCKLFIIDPMSKNIQEYYHLGIITDWHIFDLYSDNIDDIIFTGISMMYKCPVLLAFDNCDLSGVMPPFKDDHGLCGNQSFYILFPKTEIAKQQSSELQQAEFYSVDSSIIYIRTLESAEKTGLLYSFNNEMKCVSIFPTSAHTTALNKYWNDHRNCDSTLLFKIPNPNELLYFNGDSFENHYSSCKNNFQISY